MKSQFEKKRSSSPSFQEYKSIENNISRLDKLMKNVRISDDCDKSSELSRIRYSIDENDKNKIRNYMRINDECGKSNEISRVRYSINENDKNKIRNYILKSNFIEPRSIKNSTSKNNNAFECCSDENCFQEPNISNKQLVNYFKQKSLEWKNLSNNLVDTHCHFDMLFPKIRYNYSNMHKYFSDYSFLYLKNFEACINVICHPKNYFNKGK